MNRTSRRSHRKGAGRAPSLRTAVRRGSGVAVGAAPAERRGASRCRTGYHAARDTAPYGIRSHMRYHAVRNTAATPYEMPCRVRYRAVREIIRLARHVPTYLPWPAFAARSSSQGRGSARSPSPQSPAQHSFQRAAGMLYPRFRAPESTRSTRASGSESERLAHHHLRAAGLGCAIRARTQRPRSASSRALVGLRAHECVCMHACEQAGLVEAGS